MCPVPIRPDFLDTYHTYNSYHTYNTYDTYHTYNTYNTYQAIRPYVMLGMLCYVSYIYNCTSQNPGTVSI